MEPLYTLREESTTGWTDVVVSVTKDKCKEAYDKKLYNGVSPELLRIIRVK